MLNIAVFGGSFDPPHIGHETIVNKVLDNLDIDKLIVVPTFLNRFKNQFHLTPQKRFLLLKELFQNNSKVEVIDYETKQNKAVATIETIEYIENLYTNINNIYLIIGSDNLKKLSLWKDFEKLKSKVKFVVVTRENFEVKNDIIKFQTIKMDINISSSQLREHLDLDYIPNKIKQKVQKHYAK